MSAATAANKAELVNCVASERAAAQESSAWGGKLSDHAGCEIIQTKQINKEKPVWLAESERGQHVGKIQLLNWVQAVSKYTKTQALTQTTPDYRFAKKNFAF